MNHKSFKYRFYPTPEQAELLEKTFGSCRFVWNQILDWRSKEYSLNGIKINYTKTSAKMTQLRQEFPWLQEASYVALQQALRNQDKAFSGFFAKHSNYPNFKKKFNKQSFRLVGTAFSIKNNNQVFIAKCKTPLNIKWTRSLESTPSSVTISKDTANRYFISFNCEIETKELPKLNNSIGLDLGLTNFATTSNSEKIKPLKSYIKYQKLLAKLQRQHTKKQKGSKNREYSRLKIAKVHNKIADSRKDFLQKLSTKLIRENQTICLEDLNVSGMVKNHKLAKGISDASWSELVTMLKYKAEWYGRIISQISPWFPSSKLCSNCGFRLDKLPLNMRQWTCPECNSLHDRDINAAKNINTAGLAEINACGVSSVGGVELMFDARHDTLKQEIPA